MKRSPNRLLIILIVAFLLAAGLTALLAFDAVRDLAASASSQIGLNVGPVLPEGVSQENASGGDETSTIFLDPDTPIQPAGNPTPQPWDGNSRVTILVMGLDHRDWELNQGAPRSDTMILLTLDPQTGTAGMLSVPRDLWVAIPGFDYGKINTAYQLGEAYQATGGGPGLAMETVEQLLGIEIQYYALVDFLAFVRLIDEIGGVKIDVPEEITVDPLGEAPPKTLQPGVQTLPGDVALAYARARNTIGGDFDRAKRQQQVIMSIRDRILSFDLIPILIARSPAIYQEISDGVRTNMSLDLIIRLALAAGQISPDDIKRATIGPNEVVFDRSWLGQDILVPIPDNIRLIRDDIFGTDNGGSAVTVDKSLFQLVSEENANLAVLNGTIQPGLAAGTSEFLGNQGFQVTVTDNADQLYSDTTLIDYTGNPYTLQLLMEILSINPSRIFHSYDPNSSVDVAVILGQDWAASGAIP
jgi:polyisoprenyl-teichoic acid--peptidoglycan teichoic acid transferase